MSECKERFLFSDLKYLLSSLQVQISEAFHARIESLACKAVEC